jgi:hypothetical protein
VPEPSDRIEALLAAAEREADAARRDIEARRAAMEAELRGYADAARGGSDPADRAARIERLAADALRSVGELAVTLSELAQTLRASDAPAADPPAAPAPAAAPPAPGPLPASARLLAIEMAIAGHGREAVGAALEQRLGKPPPAALLDEVFGEEASLTWGRPTPPLGTG